MLADLKSVLDRYVLGAVGFAYTVVRRLGRAHMRRGRRSYHNLTLRLEELRNGRASVIQSSTWKSDSDSTYCTMFSTPRTLTS